MSQEGVSEPSNSEEGSTSAVIRFLMGHGADPFIKHDKERTVFDLIMENKDQARFQALFMHVYKPFRPHNQILHMPEGLNLERLLTKEEFLTLLSRVIQQPAKTDDVVETLFLARDQVLKLVETWKQSKLFSSKLSHRLPSVLWLLLAASPRKQRLVDRCQKVLSSLRDLDKTGMRQPAKEPQKNLKGKKRLSLSQGNTQVKAIDDQVLKTLKHLRDILRDPPYTSLHSDDHLKYKPPEAKKSSEDILNRFEAIVVHLYKKSGQSGVLRRYRTVREMIYGDGPTKVMESALKDFRDMTKDLSLGDYAIGEREAPKFVWIHLPATNVSIVSQYSSVN